MNDKYEGFDEMFSRRHDLNFMMYDNMKTLNDFFTI